MKKLSFKNPNNTKLIFSHKLINNLEVLKVSNSLIIINNKYSNDIIKNLNYLELMNSYFKNENNELRFISKNLRVFKFKMNSFLLSTFPSFDNLKELKKFKFHILDAENSINEIKKLLIQLKCFENNNSCIKSLNHFLKNEMDEEYLNFNCNYLTS